MPSPRNVDSPPSVLRLRNVLRLHGVSLRQHGKNILDAVTMEARAGELLVVEGGRGAGKTLLLEVAGARRRPDSGAIWIADHDVTGLQRHSLPFVRRNVGFLEAAPGFLPGITVLENVMLPLGARAEPLAWAREAALRALAKVGAVGMATTRIETLSTGDRRLAAIARALAGCPPLLLLDDPSASLTAADTGAVLSALLGAVENGAAAICATADAAFGAAAVRAGARRLRMDGGCLLAGPNALAVVSPGSRFATTTPLGPASGIDIGGPGDNGRSDRPSGRRGALP